MGIEKSQGCAACGRERIDSCAACMWRRRACKPSWRGSAQLEASRVALVVPHSRGRVAPLGRGLPHSYALFRIPHCLCNRRLRGLRQRKWIGALRRSAAPAATRAQASCTRVAALRRSNVKQCRDCTHHVPVFVSATAPARAGRAAAHASNPMQRCNALQVRCRCTGALPQKTRSFPYPLQQARSYVAAIRRGSACLPTRVPCTTRAQSKQGSLARRRNHPLCMRQGSSPHGGRAHLGATAERECSRMPGRAECTCS